jgi:adenine-specific DNA-methyltransferase
MSEDEHQDQIQRVTSSSPNFKTELAKKLQDLVPEAISDGKVDTKKLKELLDEDTADGSERFGLFWPGKKRAMRAAQEPTTATLKPVKEESKDWDTTENIFIEGDNLEVLKILQKHYHNKIKMIYIDPPYNTGKDFVYPDNYKEGLASYLEFTNQVNEDGRKVSTNSDTDGRYHSNWLNMIYPRLKLARNLLTDDGVIFISIDDNEQDNLKKVCNEIFGEDNFIALIPRLTSPQRFSQEKNINISHDYILVYARSSTTSLFNTTDIKEKAKVLKFDEIGSYFEGDTKAILAPVSQGYSSGGDYDFEFKGTVYKPVDKNGRRNRWFWTIQRMRAAAELGILREVGGGLRMQIYQDKKFEEKTNIMVDKETGLKSATFDYMVNSYSNPNGYADLKKLELETYFSYPKPVALMMALIQISTKEGDFILDFFSGSSSTAHAVMELNAKDGASRRHIQIQLPEPIDSSSDTFMDAYKNIAKLSVERISRAGEMIKEIFADRIAERGKPLDVGFKVFKLADTNFSKWQTNSDVDVDAVQQRLLDMRESSDDNATQEDLLTEILVKLGFPLTVKVSETNIDGMNIWDVSDKAVIAYLDERNKPTLEQLRSLADTDPGKIVILEDCFQGDDELKTNLAQICKTNNIELLTV